MARQAEAERERRAKVINAEGEFQAAARLAEAAEVISANPTRSSCATCRRSPRSADRNSTTSSRCRSTSSASLLDAAGANGANPRTGRTEALASASSTP